MAIWYTKQTPGIYIIGNSHPKSSSSIYLTMFDKQSLVTALSRNKYRYDDIIE